MYDASLFRPIRAMRSHTATNYILSAPTTKKTLAVLWKLGFKLDFVSITLT